VPGPLYTAILCQAVLVMAALAIWGDTAVLLEDRTDTQAPPPVTPDQAPPAEPGMIPLTMNVPRPLRRGVPRGCASRIFTASMAFTVNSPAGDDELPIRS
jgi:hypothetical protein